MMAPTVCLELWSVCDRPPFALSHPIWSIYIFSRQVGRSSHERRHWEPHQDKTAADVTSDDLLLLPEFLGPGCPNVCCTESTSHKLFLNWCHCLKIHDKVLYLKIMDWTGFFYSRNLHIYCETSRTTCDSVLSTNLTIEDITSWNTSSSCHYVIGAAMPNQAIISS